jgi:hypothetical protein
MVKTIDQRIEALKTVTEIIRGREAVLVCEKLLEMIERTAKLLLARRVQ